MASQHLRPLERRVLAMRDAGLDNGEIGRRIKRSAEHVERIIGWTELPRTGRPNRQTLRPLERRVLALRARGETHDQIGERFRRSAAFIKQVEGLAHYQLALQLLG